MSAAVTTVSKGETETFETQPCDAKSEQPVVENVWMKRSLEKQLAASNANKEQSQPSAEPESKDSKPSDSAPESDGVDNVESDEFQKVKGKKDKREREVALERTKEDRGKRSEKRDLERRDSDKKEKKEEKKEETVKKFDNVNYVEAPLPKTNAWAINKSPVLRSQSSESGEYHYRINQFCVNLELVYTSPLQIETD